MQHIRKLLAVFLAVVMLSLAACSSQSASPGAATPQITIDENGLASWPPVEGAVAYHYSLVDMDCLGTEPQRTTETCVQVPAGLSVHVQAAFEDGYNAGYSYGYGVRTLVDKARGNNNGSIGAFGWTGFFGAWCEADPSEELSIVYMHNRLPNREAEIHPRIRNTVYGCIE